MPKNKHTIPKVPIDIVERGYVEGVLEFKNPLIKLTRHLETSHNLIKMIRGRLLPYIHTDARSFCNGDLVYDTEANIFVTVCKDKNQYERQDKFRKVIVFSNDFSDTQLLQMASLFVMSGEQVKVMVDTSEREQFLKTPLVKLGTTDNLGDPNCETCSGHGCLDEGSMWGVSMVRCEDCYRHVPIHINRKGRVTFATVKKEESNDTRARQYGKNLF